MANPNYFAVIPANVRYSKDLNSRQKLLYAEISALSQKEGYAFASNKYWSELFGVAVETISRDVKALSDFGFVRCEIDKAGGNKRRIYLLISGGQDLLTNKSIAIDRMIKTPIDQPVNTPIDPTIKHNNIKINKTSINNKNEQGENAHTREPNHYEKANEVLLYLNEVAGKNFLPNLTNKKYIAERISEGRAVDELKEIIDLKFAQSQRTQKNGQPIFAPKYLRPQTLFSDQNCEKYINEINEIKSGKSNGFEFEGSHSKQQRRLEALRSAGIDPLAMFGYD